MSGGGVIKCHDMTSPHLRSPLFVLVLMVDAVNLQAVTFQGTPLGEGLLTVVAPIWTDSWKQGKVSSVEEMLVDKFRFYLYVFLCASSDQMYH